MYKRQDFTVSFLDMIFNTMLFFVLMFVLMLCQQKKSNEESKNIKPNELFVIDISWAKENSDDIDTYLESSDGKLVFYKDKDCGNFSIDRDDVGTSPLKEGQIHREVVTIRKIVPGEYVLNIHAYSKRSKDPVKVSIAIHKIVPFNTVFTKEIELKEDGEEQTVCRFTLDEDGNFSKVNFTPKKFTAKLGNLE